MSAVINHQEANSETAKMNFREDLDEMQQLRAIREHRDSVRHQVAMSNWYTTRASHTSHRYMLHMLVEEARRYTTEHHYNSAEGHDDGDEKAAAVGVNEDVNNDVVADEKSSQQSNESKAVEGGDIVAKDPNHNDNADDNNLQLSTPRPKQPRSPPMVGSPSTSQPTVHDELHHHIDALMMQQDNYQEALHCITHLRLFSRKVEEERSDSSNDGDANAAEETTPPQQS